MSKDKCLRQSDWKIQLTVKLYLIILCTTYIVLIYDKAKCILIGLKKLQPTIWLPCENDVIII